MKIRILTLLTFLAVTLFAGNAFAITDIGSGYTCDGTTILKGTKTVKYSKFKSNTVTTLDNLKKTLDNAPKNKKDAIKAKITAVKAVAKSVKLCSKGQLPDGQVDPLFTTLSANGGLFDGTYTGSVQSIIGNIPVSGPLSFLFTLTGTTFRTTITLGGNVGNTLNAEPLVFEADVNGLPLPLQIQISDTFIGVVNLQINADGTMTIANSDNTITFGGTFADQAINGNLNGNYKGNVFSGTFALTRK